VPCFASPGSGGYQPGSPLGLTKPVDQSLYYYVGSIVFFISSHIHVLFRPTTSQLMSKSGTVSKPSPTTWNLTDDQRQVIEELHNNLLHTSPEATAEGESATGQAASIGLTDRSAE